MTLERGDSVELTEFDLMGSISWSRVEGETSDTAEKDTAHFIVQKEDSYYFGGATVVCIGDGEKVDGKYKVCTFFPYDPVLEVWSLHLIDDCVVTAE